MATFSTQVGGLKPSKQRHKSRCCPSPVAGSLTPALTAGVAETAVSGSLSPILGGNETPCVKHEGSVTAAQVAALLVKDKVLPSFREAFKSGLRKGIEKFLEKSGEILAVLFWSLVTLWVIIAILGFQVNLDSIKALKDAFPLF